MIALAGAPWSGLPTWSLQRSPKGVSSPRVVSLEAEVRIGPCTSNLLSWFLFLNNKLLQMQLLNTMYTCYLRVSVGQESRQGLAGSSAWGLTE